MLPFPAASWPWAISGLQFQDRGVRVRMWGRGGGEIRSTSSHEHFSRLSKGIHVRPDLMRDRKRRSKTKNGVFRSGFFDQKKIRKAIYFFLIEKSRSKNAVFRFRSRIRSGLTSRYCCEITKSSRYTQEGSSLPSFPRPTMNPMPVADGVKHATGILPLTPPPEMADASPPALLLLFGVISKRPLEPVWKVAPRGSKQNLIPIFCDMDRTGVICATEKKKERVLAKKKLRRSSQRRKERFGVPNAVNYNTDSFGSQSSSRSALLTDLNENLLDVQRALGRGLHVDQPVVRRVLVRLVELHLPVREPESTKMPKGVCVYVCMDITYSKSKDQPGKVANPARGQLA